MISESISECYFPGVNPVGKRFCFSGAFAPRCALEIVSVVRDARYSNLREASQYTVYLPVLQSQTLRADLQARTCSEPEAMLAQVQEALPALRCRATRDPYCYARPSGGRFHHPGPPAGSISAFFRSARIGAIGAGHLRGHRLQRPSPDREIGVRMALGASKSTVKWMVLRDVILLTACGTAIGVPAALAASRLGAACCSG